MTIAFVDLGISNLASLFRAFDRVGAGRMVRASVDDLGRASAVVLPGVGAFGEGMAQMRAQGLDVAIQGAARAGTPIFGICLGMQLLARSSDEHGFHQGLGLLQGHVSRLPESASDRVPNIGWCDVNPVRSSVLFPERAPGCFYHVHSYHLVPDDRHAVTATMRFGGAEIVVAVEQDNIFGVQFHPEKSQDDGLGLLATVLTHVRRLGRSQ